MSEEQITDWVKYRQAEDEAGRAVRACHGDTPSIEHQRVCPAIKAFEAAERACSDFERRFHITRRRYYD